MSEGKVVARRRVRYPVGDDLDRLVEVGGLSNLDPEERREIAGRMKVVDPAILGDEAFIDDAPPGAIEGWLRDGTAEEVGTDVEDLSREDLISHIQTEADADELVGLRAAEEARARPRVTVLRAIDERLDGGDR